MSAPAFGTAANPSNELQRLAIAAFDPKKRVRHNGDDDEAAPAAAAAAPAAADADANEPRRGTIKAKRRRILASEFPDEGGSRKRGLKKSKKSRKSSKKSRKYSKKSKKSKKSKSRRRK